jgi:hypothetical protein
MIRKPAEPGTPKPAEKKSFPRWIWQGRIAPAFWTVASVISLVTNLILIAALILVGRQLFLIKSLVQDGLIGGLYDNFVKMDAAHIQTDIQVNASIPIQFDLPVSTDTTVVLTRDTEIPDTFVALNTVGSGINLSINAPANITLPVGTPLDIHLEIVVPVSTTVPISLPVHVDIPLNQTELHEPFVGLQNVVAPYRTFLSELPNTWQGTPICSPGMSWLCNWVFDIKEPAE